MQRSLTVTGLQPYKKDAFCFEGTTSELFALLLTGLIRFLSNCELFCGCKYWNVLWVVFTLVVLVLIGMFLRVVLSESLYLFSELFCNGITGASEESSDTRDLTLPFVQWSKRKWWRQEGSLMCETGYQFMCSLLAAYLLCLLKCSYWTQEHNLEY